MIADANSRWDTNDPHIKALVLSTVNGDPDAGGTLYSYLLSTIRRLQQTALFPSASEAEVANAEIAWLQLSEDISSAAENVWWMYACPDNSIESARKQWRATDAQERIQRLHVLSQLTHYAQLFLLLWVETSLYRIREHNNKGQDFELSSDAVVSSVHKLLRERALRIARWRHDLLRLTGRTFFKPTEEEARYLLLLSKEFAPERVLPQEVGWLLHAAPVSQELRYRYFDSLRTAKLAQRRFGVALALEVMNVTTGYGMRPTRLLRVFFVSINSFALLYLFYDLYGGCASPKVARLSDLSDIIATLVHYLSTSILHTFSIAPDSGLCQGAGGTPVLEGLVGIFFLLLLGTLVGRSFDAQ